MASTLCNHSRKVNGHDYAMCLMLAAPGIELCPAHAAMAPETHAKCDECGAWCVMRGSTLTGQSWRCPEGHVSRRAAPTKSSDEPVRRERLG